jgi:hypothetical protein
MGYELVLGTCWACHSPFTFNPDLVPSVPVDPETDFVLDVAPDGSARAFTAEEYARAIKQPICESCIRRTNALRRESGLSEIHVLPGAYDVREA